ncbi:hypothetical protein ABIB75_004252 [Bradyrhizobium sp. GM2.2]|jgi:hypothetical protein|uniref:hypothetical protein n=1 Tax=unclassified Bradyrhizobium TaxID=2631580 RepID=UPI001FF723DA|nr:MULTISPECIES: hypothetical protein [unclassified Bradyrhizobium]MCK1520069.1 hypothetical protein [Bradyrhizobium sp. 17]MCK1690636.1 hypothetical protein [Bradyrhizobium sp. 145]UPJ75074.1 hypothetical protein IVB19_11365 [Bradyrhizobium sp. 187]
MAVATGGVIAAAVVIITAGAEAEAITMVGGTIATGKRHYLELGGPLNASDPQSLALPDGQNPPHAGQSIGSPIF